MALPLIFLGFCLVSPPQQVFPDHTIHRHSPISLIDSLSCFVFLSSTYYYDVCVLVYVCIYVYCLYSYPLVAHLDGMFHEASGQNI